MGAQGRNGYQGREADRSAQCVWMQGGLVSYKLCDRRLDCEHCPFDAALRAGSPPAAGDSTFLAGAGPAQLHVRPAGESKQVDGYEFAEAFFYHPAHVWAHVIGGGRVRVGIDDFGQRLLGRFYAVELPAPGTKVTRGRACWRAAHRHGQAALISPVTGTVREVNPRLAQLPSLLNRDPYGDGWAFVVEPIRLAECLKRLLYGRKAEDWSAFEVERLYRQANEILNQEVSGRPPAGSVPTLPDGGDRRQDFMRELSAAQARSLLDSFFPAGQSGGKTAFH